MIFINKGINFSLQKAEESKENTARKFIFKIIDSSYTQEFIFWFFEQIPIQEYLSLFSRGNIISFLPKTAFEELEIIAPQKINENFLCVNIGTNSEFKEVIQQYFSEYQSNIKSGNYLSASFLVGGICEAILYQYLIDKGVKKKLLERKMYGELLEIIQIMDLKIPNFDDFVKIKKFRNLIHPKNAMSNIDNIGSLEKEVESTFNRIIKSFGI